MAARRHSLEVQTACTVLRAVQTISGQESAQTAERFSTATCSRSKRHTAQLARRPKRAVPLQSTLSMLARKPKARRITSSEPGTVDGGEGRGIPLGGHDDRPPTGYRSLNDVDIESADNEDAALFWEDEDPADRRKDPLRKP